MYLLVGCGDRSMTQLSLLASDFGNAIKIRTHHRREDGETSREAARRVVPKLTEQQDSTLDTVRNYGPGTAPEMAYRACFAHSVRVLNEKWETEWRYMMSRRLPELEAAGLVTCGRIRDSEGKTIKQDVKVCSVKRTRQAIWRIS